LIISISAGFQSFIVKLGDIITKSKLLNATSVNSWVYTGIEE